MPGSIPISIQILTSSSYPAKFICIGKVRFNMDFFEIKSGDKRAIYEAVIFEDSGNKKFQLTQTKSLGDLFLIKVPMESGDASKVNATFLLYTFNETPIFSAQFGTEVNGVQTIVRNRHQTTQIRLLTNVKPTSFQSQSSKYSTICGESIYNLHYFRCNGLAFKVEQAPATTVELKNTVTTASSIEATVNKNEVTQSSITTSQTVTETSATTMIATTTMAATTDTPVTSIQTTLTSSMKTDTTQNVTPMTTIISSSLPSSPVSTTVQTSPTTISTIASTVPMLSTIASTQSPTPISSLTTSVNSVSQATTIISQQLSTLTAIASSLDTLASNETEKLTSNATDNEVSAKIESSKKN